ncbi:MAG: DnaJ domain-containing protein [Pseudomonadales bacterium]|nr:DnaJ domain-containing protein [Pseudomonadales bacterium]
MSDSNPLVIPILRILRHSTAPQTLLGLFDQCSNELALLVTDSEQSELALFQKNFFLMNALYQIQVQVLEEGYFLSVSPLDIQLTDSDSTAGSQLAVGGGGKLATYYLNWDNLKSISSDEVEHLLNQFWERYLSLDKEQEAKEILGIRGNLAWTETVATYRRLASENHPDRGGSAANFVKIREAYEVLKALNQ